MNVLCTAFRFSEEERQQIERTGVTLHLLEREEDVATYDVSEIEGIICNNLFLYRDVDDFPHLRFVQVVSAGLDRVPVERLKARQIELHNAGDAYAVPMAEWVVWQLLDFYKRGPVFRAQQQEKRWEKQRRLIELTDRTVTVLGVGHVGEAVATRLRAFGMYVIGVGRRARDVPFVDEYVQFDRLDDVLERSDVIVIALPLTEQTHYLFDKTRFERVKEGAILLNVARGAIVDETALLYALETKKVAGAALDVFETEPLPRNHPFWTHPAVQLTPHNSYVSDRVNRRLFRTILRNLTRQTTS
ncbi:MULTISPECIES: NAD(P)-dependent oxidoreductase [Exiguobacterium]|uniref:NAD(P)-dependent oxidoreductase n=1 Tax=Exiguobacterium TaxID=33986 RepID=UPI001BE6F3B1|nr:MULTISPECIES: NAD(P)-dependent oxidoreductase [Exiguobacterium]MCT4781652.1 D-2-hydroxyacid dehydrogenase [Exiguobacterium himgiriensis]